MLPDAHTTQDVCTSRRILIDLSHKKANPTKKNMSNNKHIKTLDSSNKNNNDDDATTPSVVAPISSATAMMNEDDDGRAIVFETKSAYSPIIAALIILIPLLFFGLGIASLVRYDEPSADGAGINFGVGVFLAFLYTFVTPRSFQVCASNKVLARNWLGCTPFQFHDCVSAELVSPALFFHPLCSLAMAFRGLVLLHYRGCCKSVLLSPSDPDGFCAAIERVVAQQQEEPHNPGGDNAV